MCYEFQLRWYELEIKTIVSRASPKHTDAEWNLFGAEMTFLSQMGSPSSPPPHRPFWKVMLLLDCLSCQKTQLLSAWICCFSSWNKINKRKKPKSFKPSKWECFLFAPLSSLGHITDDIFLHSCIRWAYKDRRGILKPASVAYGCIDKREIGLDKLGQCIKKRDIALPTKVPIVNALVFPVIRCGCESWTIRKADCRSIDVFELWCWTRLLRVPWTAKRSN